MKKIALIGLATLAAAPAQAATLKNTDKTLALVTVQTDEGQEEIRLKPNDTYNSDGKKVTFTLGAHADVHADSDEAYEIENGKIIKVRADKP